MTKAGTYNKRVNGKMRRVQINAKGQWKFLKGKPRAAPKTHKPKRSKSHKPKRSKSHKPKHHNKRQQRSRSKGMIFG